MNPYLQPHFPFISISPIPSGILTESSYPWKYTLCSPLPLHPIVSFVVHFLLTFCKNANQNKAQIKRHNFHSHTSPLYSLKRNICCMLDALSCRCIPQFHLLCTFLLTFCKNANQNKAQIKIHTFQSHTSPLYSLERNICKQVPSLSLSRQRSLTLFKIQIGWVFRCFKLQTIVSY